jgi:hypothetical protein
LTAAGVSSICLARDPEIDVGRSARGSGRQGGLGCAGGTLEPTGEELSPDRAGQRPRELLHGDGDANADVPDLFGIGLMSDGDQTDSVSSADFAEFTLE